MLDALLGELDFRALLIMLDATCNVMPRVSLGQAAATVLGLAFIGTFLLGIEDAHYRLVLTSTAPDAGETEDMQCLQERLNQVRSPEGPSQPAAQPAQPAQPAKPVAEMAVDVAVARQKKPMVLRALISAVDGARWLKTAVDIE